MKKGVYQIIIRTGIPIMLDYMEDFTNQPACAPPNFNLPFKLTITPIRITPFSSIHIRNFTLILFLSLFRRPLKVFAP